MASIEITDLIEIVLFLDRYMLHAISISMDKRQIRERFEANNKVSNYFEIFAIIFNIPYFDILDLTVVLKMLFFLAGVTPPDILLQRSTFVARIKWVSHGQTTFPGV